jgi:hypothetical protein
MELLQDERLVGFTEQRILRTAQEFGLDSRSFPRPVLLVRRPKGTQCHYLQPGFVIFVTAGEDRPQQARYQISHEVVHGVLSPCAPVFDWVQEMFATYIAVKAMEEAGHWEYAAEEKASLQAEADQLEFESVQDLSLPYPEGTHALTFQIGCRLVEAVGWERLKQLGTMIDEQRARHDLGRWVGYLDRSDREVVTRILAGSAAGEC